MPVGHKPPPITFSPLPGDEGPGVSGSRPGRIVVLRMNPQRRVLALALLLLTTLSVLTLPGCALESRFYGAERRDYPTPAGVEDVYVRVGPRAGSRPTASATPPADGPFVHCWLYPAPARVDSTERSPAILFCHGARTQIDEIGPGLAPMAQRAGAALMLVSYRGFGRSSPIDGPTRASTADDAAAALAALRARPDIDPDRIVVMGYSLGGPPALAAAVRSPVAGVIIGGTFSSAAAALEDRELSHLRLLLGGDFDPVDTVRRLEPTPLYLFHGESDGACPVYHAYALAAAASRAGVPVRLDIVPGAGHRSIFRDDPALFDRLAGFVRAATDPARVRANARPHAAAPPADPTPDR